MHAFSDPPGSGLVIPPGSGLSRSLQRLSRVKFGQANQPGVNFLNMRFKV